MLSIRAFDKCREQKVRIVALSKCECTVNTMNTRLLKTAGPSDSRSDLGQSASGSDKSDYLVVASRPFGIFTLQRLDSASSQEQKGVSAEICIQKCVVLDHRYAIAHQTSSSRPSIAATEQRMQRYLQHTLACSTAYTSADTRSSCVLLHGVR